jgi:hypothetical protein
MYFQEICGIQAHLQAFSESGDYVLSAMTEKIKTKYNKYWGDLDRVNLMLFVVVVLDPRTKLDSLDYWFKEVLSVEQVPLGQIITTMVRFPLEFIMVVIRQPQ